MNIPVYDGYVKLVTSMGDDNTPLIAARMSTSNPTGINLKADDNLRERLLYDLHTSAFQGIVITIEMELPLASLRQIERHRTLLGCSMEIVEIDDEWRKFQNRNEFSGRYSQMTNKYYIPDVDRIEMQSSINKQGGEDSFSTEKKQGIVTKMKGVFDFLRGAYDEFIADKLSNEVSRFILPGAQYVRAQYTADILNWAKMLGLRLKKDVQPETRKYCEAIATILQSIVPKTFAGMEEHIIWAEKLSKSEFALVSRLLKSYIDFLGEDRTYYSLKDDIEKTLGERGAKRFIKKLGIDP